MHFSIFPLSVLQNREFRTMNLNEECLLKYLQNPEELVDLTDFLLEFNKNYEQN